MKPKKTNGGRLMSELEELKPTKKQRVMDLVNAAGIDVSNWANFDGGKKREGSNPKYCYEWSFVEPGRIVLLNLWYSNIRERRGEVFINFNLRESVQRNSKRGGKEVWRARAEKFDLAIQEASRNGLPIRVVVNDGRKRDANNPKTKHSHVSRRLLDPVPWAVKSYDWKTGECTLVRGALAGRLVDQFSVPAENEADVDRREVSELRYNRDPTLRARSLGRAKGKCEYCGEIGFSTPDGGVFLETHHVIPLGEGGADVEENVAAICPNHHSEAHYGARKGEIRRVLMDRLRSILSKSNRTTK